MINTVYPRQILAQLPVHFRKLLVVASCVSTCVACGPESEADRTTVGPIQGRFYVSDVFAPSGHMGDGENPGFITADINDHCKDRAPGAGGACYRFTWQPDVRPGAAMWAGVYWVYPSNDWGARPGRLLYPPYKRIRFKAAAEKRPMDPSNPTLKPEPVITALVGGIGSNAADPQPYKDETVNDAVGGDIFTLTEEWQDLSIDISEVVPQDKPFHMISGFCWTANYQPGVPTAQTPPTVIYLDDIVWDTE